MGLVRVVRAVAFAGAGALGLLALLPLGAAAAPAPIAFSGNAQSAGVLFSIDTNPQLTPVPDLFDVRAPMGTTTLTSAGESYGTASLASPGNSGTGDKLLCQAQAQITSFCNGLSGATSKTPIGPFPPDYPLGASASYPENNGKPVSPPVAAPRPIGAGGPAVFAAGQAQAQALAQEIRTTASIGSASMLAGTPAAVTTGSETATTHQISGPQGLMTQATSTLHDVVIAGVLHIASIETTAAITNDGHGHVKRAGSVTFGGVTAFGQPATITNHGVQIAGQGSGSGLIDSLNAALQKALAGAQITMKLVGVKTGNAGGALTEQAGGLLITYQRPINLQPDPTNFVRSILPCFPPPQFNAGCDFAVPSPNALYFGSYTLGDASVTNFAGQGSTFGVGGLTFGGGTLGGGNGLAGGGTRYLPGTPGTPGSPALPGTTAGTATAGSGQSPVVAGSGASRASGTTTAGGLAGVSNRLTYIFPALLLAAIGVLAGRFLPYPSRLPTS